MAFRKLTDSQAYEARVRHEKGDTIRSLAEEYGLSLKAMQALLVHETYKSAGGPRRQKAQWLRRDASEEEKRAEALRQLFSKIQVQPNGCWHFTGNLDNSGYGRIQVAGIALGAHLVSLEFFKGPRPEGMVGHHECHYTADCDLAKNDPHRRCVNPAHLFWVSKTTNSRRGNTGKHLSDRTHCPQGHVKGHEELP